MLAYPNDNYREAGSGDNNSCDTRSTEKYFYQPYYDAIPAGDKYYARGRSN